MEEKKTKKKRKMPKSILKFADPRDDRIVRDAEDEDMSERVRKPKG